MTEGLSPEFLRAVSGQRRGSLMAGCLTRGFMAKQSSALNQYGLCEDTSSLKALLSSVSSWDFDVFALSELAKGRPLFYLGLHLFAQYGLVETFNMDIMNLVRFLSMTEKAYHIENPYHNSLHAADVLQALHSVCQEPKIHSSITPIERLASILAAILHDVDHPGVNQTFLINTSSYLTYIHGEHSLLEQHHIHSAHGIITESRLLDHLPKETQETILGLVDSLILVTDFTEHKQYLEEFDGRLSHGLDMEVVEDRVFVLKMAMKCADISNQARTWNVCQNWSRRITEEFFRQGDNERSLRLPISFLCDRNTVNVPDSQKGFILFMARPLFSLWDRLMMSQTSRHIISNLDANKSNWEKVIE